jgi:hypothetical protein
MWSVVDYRPHDECPVIRVQHTETLEIVSFPIEQDGSLGRSDGRFDLGPARLVAISYLFALNKRAA